MLKYCKQSLCFFVLVLISLFSLVSCGGGNVGTGADYQGQTRSADTGQIIGGLKVQVELSGNLLGETESDPVTGNYLIEGDKPEVGDIVTYKVFASPNSEASVASVNITEGSSVLNAVIVSADLLLPVSAPNGQLIIQDFGVTEKPTPAPTATPVAVNPGSTPTSIPQATATPIETSPPTVTPTLGVTTTPPSSATPPSGGDTPEGEETPAASTPVSTPTPTSTPASAPGSQS